MERRPMRRPLSSGDLGKPPDQHVITHLPATVTMRRPQSPTRRPDLTSNRYSGQSDVSNDGPPVPEPGANKFFLASEAHQAAKTSTPTTTTQKKPAFFTANSFSATKTSTQHATPEFRRAESATEVRTRSNSRPMARRTPTIRDPSPVRQVNGASRLRPATIPKLAAASQPDSPSPFASVRAIPNFQQDQDETPSKNSAPQVEPKLQRQKSAITLKTLDRKSNEALPILKSPAKERTLRPQNRTSDSAVSASSVVDNADLSEQNPLSPASSATTTQTDYFESQPAQTNRKIMDLEIRTTSLLAVNTQLERQQRKQAAEVKDLRKKLAHAMKYPGSFDKDNVSAREMSPEDVDDSIDEVPATDDLQEVGMSLLRAASRVDQSIKRALLLSDQLLADAKRGLSYRPRESEIGVGVLRVLHSSTPDVSVDEHSRTQSMRRDEETSGYVPGNVLDDADISGLDLT